MAKTTKVKRPTRLFVTFHGDLQGHAFDDVEKAQRYPGPRGYETHRKDVVLYIRADRLAALCRRLGKDVQDLLEEAAQEVKQAARQAARGKHD